MKKYDFTLKSDQSFKDVKNYMAKYGQHKTMKKLVEALGKDSIVDVYHSVLYVFENHLGLVEIRDVSKEQTIHFHPLDKV